MANGEERFELSPEEWWQLIVQYYAKDSAEYKAAEDVKKRLDKGEYIPITAWPVYNIVAQKHIEFLQFIQGLGPEPSPEMTPYQKWQTEWAERTWGKEQRKEAVEWGAQQRQQAWERGITERELALRGRQQPQGLSGEQMRTLSAEFDAWKMRALQDPSIAGPAGWIRRYMIEQVQNPFAYEKQRQIHRAKAPPDVFTEAGTYKGPTTFVAGSHVETPSSEAVARYERKKQTAWGRREPARPKRPTLPMTPEGLAQFVPGLTTGEQITKQPVLTPSGQQWAATPWSQKEQLRGYAGWAGGRPYEDIVGQMIAMLPQAPRGVSSKWYRPQRQW